jgi:uncharacterized protein YndB with AHSA1/START domain
VIAETQFVVEPNRQDVVITRTFAAPPDAVYRVMTDPALVPDWWGPRRLITRVDQMEVRPGGSWRFVQLDPDGNEYGFHGVYHDVVPGQRVVQTFEFEALRGTCHWKPRPWNRTTGGRATWPKPSTSRWRRGTPWSAAACRRVPKNCWTASPTSSSADNDRRAAGAPSHPAGLVTRTARHTPGMDDPVPDRFRGALSHIVDRIVAGDYAGMARDHTSDPDADVGMWARQYPATFVSLPPEAWDHADALYRPESDAWHVVLPLWSAEEGRSDMCLELTVRERSGQLEVEIDTLHVM